MRYRRPKDHKEKIDALIKRGILLQKENVASFIGEEELYIEIGMGRGDFLTEHAKRYPERKFLGIERQVPLLILAGKKIEEASLSNIRLIGSNASDIESLIPPDSVEGIYLNFSDPWAKQRYAKRRLTHLEMLRKYENISKNGAKLFFKTDDLELFRFSIQQIKMSRYEITREIWDLYAPDLQQELGETDPIYIKTEYEKKFISLKKTIFSLECTLV